MRRDENVAWSPVEKRKASLEVTHCMRIFLPASEQEAISRYRRQAIGINQVQTAAVFAGAPSPACASWRVARRQMRRDGDGPGLQGFAIPESLHLLDSGAGNDAAELRIVARHCACFHGVRGPLARRYASAAKLLQFGNTAAVIEVDVRVDDELDILHAKTKRMDIGNDLRHRLW